MPILIKKKKLVALPTLCFNNFNNKVKTKATLFLKSNSTMLEREKSISQQLAQLTFPINTTLLKTVHFSWLTQQSSKAETVGRMLQVVALVEEEVVAVAEVAVAVEWVCRLDEEACCNSQMVSQPRVAWPRQAASSQVGEESAAASR